VRYLLISVPYRQKLHFSLDGLHAASQAVERIGNTLRRLEHAPPADGDGALPPATVEQFDSEFRSALADDLNTARALGALHVLLREINTALDGNGVSAGVRATLDEAFGMADGVLAVFPSATGTEGDAGIDRLVAERDAARASKNWARADEIRDELAAAGIVLEDTPHGTVWHRKS
jgi:cysteinyl-tRNA synthetase